MPWAVICYHTIANSMLDPGGNILMPCWCASRDLGAHFESTVAWQCIVVFARCGAFAPMPMSHIIGLVVVSAA